jgi:HAD superfamily hydrolase (TIGR01549 family)
MVGFPEYIGLMKDWPRVEAVPGAAEMLARLHTDWILCLATNAADSTETDIRAALRRVELEKYIDKIYCFKTVGHKKPFREFFDHILRDLGLSAENVIMVGDDYITDVLGAQQAGLRAVWFNSTSWKDFQVKIEDD